MKKLILIFATAILGLASCQQKTDDKAAIELAKQAAIDSMKMVAQAQEVKQMVIDSMQKAHQQLKLLNRLVRVLKALVPVSGANNSSPAKVEKTSSSSSSSTNTASTPTVTKKK
jgi:hypothetical protein